jgi:hypothetical protein
MSTSATDVLEVTLTLAPSEGLLRVVRLAASSLAADAGFEVHDVEDLVLAVDELSAALFAAADGEVSITLRADGVGVTAIGRSTSGADIELGELATSILNQACDLYEVRRTGGGPMFSMAKILNGAE